MFSKIIKTLILLALVSGLFLGSIAGVAWYQARVGKIGEPDRANFKELGLPGADKPGGGAGAKTRSTAAKSEKKASGKEITAPTSPASTIPESTEKPNKEGAAKSDPEKAFPPEKKTEPAKTEPKKNDTAAGSQSKTPDKP